MAKLTLSFKDRILKVYTLPGHECVVGRDPGCCIVIDSLAVQPQHARFFCTDDGYAVEPINGECTLRVGDLAVEEAVTLNEGDSVHIGKHRLRFSVGEQPRAVADDGPVRLGAAWLQIENGAHLGRTIRLEKGLTRVGKPEAELAVIARRDDGYYLSALRGELGPQLNGQPIGEQSRRLQHEDHLRIGELEVRFFSQPQDVSDRHSGADIPREDAPRRFSRIPFEVAASLQQGQQRWETHLLDISLHGALIALPQTFVAGELALYTLSIHLEGGNDIDMQVEIVHQGDDRLGLRCSHIDLESITHLRRLVELNLGDPQLVERELSALG